MSFNKKHDEQEQPYKVQERKLITLCLTVGIIMLAALIRRMF